MITRARLIELSEMVFLAAMRARKDDPLLFKHILDTNKRQPLNTYFFELCAFIIRRPLDAESTLFAFQALNNPDAVEIIFLDALPYMEQQRGRAALSDDEIKLLRSFYRIIRTWQDEAYKSRLGLRPSVNDNNAGRTPL